MILDPKEEPKKGTFLKYLQQCFLVIKNIISFIFFVCFEEILTRTKLRIKTYRKAFA